MTESSLENLLSDASFIGWIRGEATPIENVKWEEWLKKDPIHQEFVGEVKDILLAVEKDEVSLPEIYVEWQKLEQNLDQEENQSTMNRAHKNLHLLNKGRATVISVLFIIVVFVGAFFLYSYQSLETSDTVATSIAKVKQEYRTGYGEKATFRLSDNSTIVLNANSSIQFSSAIEGEFSTTDVWLDGEALFDITHLEGDDRRIFTVHTNDGDLRVLGTRFVVNTTGNETRAVLEEGKIEVRLANQQINQENGYNLQPGEMALFSSESERVTLKKVNTRIFTSWKDDTWFFENTPLRDVAQRIEDTFGIDVKMQEELGARKLSGSIKSTNLEVIKEALAKILDVDIKQKDEVLFIGFNHTTQK
jgi:ferric-dicitrate binding protein FerR (iron transport regulator)